MSTIVQSYDASNNAVYPVTHLRAVRDSSGTTLESMMQDVREMSVGYYECSTPGSTAVKTITTDSSVSLSTKILCKVKFVEKNTANNATMDINGTGAKALYYNGVRAAANNSWYPNEVVDLYYDGTNYQAKSCTDTLEYDVSLHQTHEITEITKTTRTLVFNGNVVSSWESETSISDSSVEGYTRSETNTGQDVDSTTVDGPNATYDSSANQTNIVYVTTHTYTHVVNNYTFQEAVNAVPMSYRHGGLKLRFISNSGSGQSSDNKYVQWRLMAQNFTTDTTQWQGVDDEPTAGSENLVTSGGVKRKIVDIEEIIYGEEQKFDPTKAYFTIQLDNTSTLDSRSVWDNTNIKNETPGSCTIDFGDGSSPISIVNRDSLVKNNVPAGTYIVSITGITSVLGNTVFRESSLLIGAKLPSTLTSVTGWLFNGVPNMSEITFMGTTPPTFSCEGISPHSLNLVSKIKVPSSALSAYQSSTMSDAMKVKLEAIDEGIVGGIASIKTDVTNLQNSLDETNESVEELADYVYSNVSSIDKTKTYFTIEVSAGNIDLKTIYNHTNIKNETEGTCTIDFGDGTPVVAISNADDLIHNYTQAGTYTLIVTGLTGLTSNLLFRAMSILKDAKFGNTFVNPSTYFMLNDVIMDSVTFFSTIPLTWNYDYTSTSNMNLISKIIVPKESLFLYLKAWYFNSAPYNKDLLKNKIVPDEPVDFYYRPVTVTVGQLGDFDSINDAIQNLSSSYPLYQYGGLKAVIKILSGTTIAEQVYVDGLDLSWITIEYEDYNPASLNYDSIAESIANGTIVFDETEGYNSVAVDASSWTSAGVTHDTRGDVCLFRAENGGRLPIINCVFKLATPNSKYPTCGCLCNRGSEAIIKTLCGFIGFQDGVISNNESSITIREGITMNCSRWGCHARHNGEVSARSVIATGCATDTTKASEYGAAVADRVADMDVREAYLGGNYAIRCHNASSICARATHVIGGGVENAYLVQATYSGRINASQITFTGITEGSKMFEVLYAGWIDAFGVIDKTYNVSSLNTISDVNGIIWG